MRPSLLVALAALAVLPALATAKDWKGHARLDGRVTDQDGEPVSGATVTVQSLAGHGGPVVRTDGEGSWIVDGIAAGSWVLRVTAPGYGPRRIGVHLPDESAWLAPVDVRLERTPAVAHPRSTEAEPSGDRIGEPTDEKGDAAVELRAALETGRVDRAHELLAGMGKDTQMDEGVLVEMGTAFLTAGWPADAVTLFDRAVERDGTHPSAHFRRALALLALGRAEDARADFERVLELSPEGEEAEKARQALEQLVPFETGATR